MVQKLTTEFGDVCHFVFEYTENSVICVSLCLSAQRFGLCVSFCV